MKFFFIAKHSSINHLPRNFRISRILKYCSWKSLRQWRPASTKSTPFPNGYRLRKLGSEQSVTNSVYMKNNAHDQQIFCATLHYFACHTEFKYISIQLSVHSQYSSNAFVWQSMFFAFHEATRMKSHTLKMHQSKFKSLRWAQWLNLNQLTMSFVRAKDILNAHWKARRIAWWH